MLVQSLPYKLSIRERGEIRPLKPVHVLVVDDDVDSALLVLSIFKQFGCHTTCALNPSEAKKRISSGLADIIILDWKLSDTVMADIVLQESIQFIDRFAPLRNRMRNHKAKIISYSSLRDKDVQLPLNQYFEHVDHWQKPISRSGLIHNTAFLLQDMGF
jgi:CheY-like chemotaxis protein